MAGDPHRAQISQFELLKLILLLKLEKQFPVEQIEATVSQSAVPPPLFIIATSGLRAAAEAALLQLCLLTINTVCFISNNDVITITAIIIIDISSSMIIIDNKTNDKKC